MDLLIEAILPERRNSKIGMNMFLNLDKKKDSNIAVMDDSGAKWTYGELCGFAEEFAHVMPKRTLLFILAENTIDSLLGYVGALSNGMVPLVISRNTDEELYRRFREIYSPAYIWEPTEMAAQAGDERIYIHGSYSLLKTGLESPALNDSLALLLPTSGSTGSPKLVRHTYKNIEANARNVAEMFKISPDDRAMGALPMHYTMGLSVIASHLYAGAMVFLSKRSLTDKVFWDTMKNERITSFTGVPFSFEVLQRIRFFRMNLPDLKIITQGGGKMSNELFKECCDYAERTGKQFIPTYGQTECTARMAFLPFELASQKIGSIGRAEPNGQLSIVDNEGNESFEGVATGEMVYRGENVTMGYAERKEDLLKGDENHGVMHTGDIARRDEDGCYFIIGRMKRFLKIFGLRISLDEVEHLVKSNFDTDCVCSGTDELLKVYITNDNMVNKVLDFVMEKTHLYHQNVNVLFVEEIKRNEAGKVILHD